MLELGDQVIEDPAIAHKTEKYYFKERGVEHVSVDINGRDGAEVHDLTKPMQFQQWHGRWHVITNAGTTEYVEPLESQNEIFPHTSRLSKGRGNR